MKRKVSLMISIALIISLITVNVFATRASIEEISECVETCGQIIDAADAHIENLDKLLIDSERLNETLEENLLVTRAELAVEIRNRRAWYNRPSFLIPVSFIAGFLAYRGLEN